MSGGDVLLRNHYVHLVHHSHANATSYFFEKISVEANDRGEVEMQEASREILGNIALVRICTILHTHRVVIKDGTSKPTQEEMNMNGLS